MLIVPQILTLMCDIEDDDEWATKDDAEDEDGETFVHPLLIKIHINNYILYSL